MSRERLLLHFGVPIVFATFFRHLCDGFIGVHLSHRYLAHPKVLLPLRQLFQ